MAGILIFAGGWWARSTNLKQGGEKVVRVIDGDTLELESKQRIRLITIDAPELGFCGSEEAKNYLEKLVLGKRIKIKGTINEGGGRLLATVYVDNMVINEEIVRAGWAEYTSQDSEERERIRTAGEEARRESRGIFGICRQKENPNNPKCNIKGNIKEGVKIYFYPGCGNYSNVILELNKGERWFCREEEAVAAGFEKAKNCLKKYESEL